MILWQGKRAVEIVGKRGEGHRSPSKDRSEVGTCGGGGAGVAELRGWCGAAGARGQETRARSGRGASVAQRALYCNNVGWRRADPFRASVVS